MLYDNQDLLTVKQSAMGERSFTIEGNEVKAYTLQDYQNEALKILEEIKRVCQKHQIRYFLMYGTLLGAVRHKGFIPWDDDADIVMTREQYDLFSKICKDELRLPYELMDYQRDKDYGYIFPRVRNKNSVYMLKSEVSNVNSNVGIYVDIILLDYLSEHPIMKKIQIRFLLYLHRIVSPGFFQGKVHTTAMEEAILRLMKMLIGKKNTLNIIIKVLSCTPRNKTSQVLSNLLLHNRLDFLIYPKDHFERTISAIFEGVSFDIPHKPLTLLNLMYGRGIKRAGYALEPEYGDEEALIGEKNIWIFDDFLFIPLERQRDRHLEILFDPQRGLEHYSHTYVTLFDKRKNDKSARKERQYREKASKYVAIMEANSTLVGISCKEVQLKDFLNDHIDWIAEKIKIQDFTELIKKLISFELLSHKETSKDDLKFCMEIFMESGLAVYAYRIAKRILFLYPEKENQDTDIKESLSLILLQFQFHLKMIQNKKAFESKIYKLIEKIFLLESQLKNSVILQLRNTKCSIYQYLYEGTKLFLNKDYDRALAVFSQIERKNNHLFAPFYYMGLIYEHKKDYEQALKYFQQSLNTTTFMPYLSLSMERIENLRFMEQNQ